MKNPHAVSREDLERITPEALRPFLDHLTACREDAYKRGFWYGVIFAATLFMASSFVVVFFRL